MTDTDLTELPIQSLKPGRYQNRTVFEDAGLSSSIAQEGVLEPILVRPVPGGEGYEILAGERRWRAAIAAGLKAVPVVLRTGLSEADAALVTVTENYQRQDLNPIDEANGFRTLTEQGLTHEQIAVRLGMEERGRVVVSNSLRLLKLDAQVQGYLKRGELDAGHGRALLGLPERLRADYARRAVRDGMSVRALEDAVRRFRDLLDGKPAKVAKPPVDADVALLARELSERLGFPVEVDGNAKGGGTIKIRYFTLDDAQTVFDAIQQGTGSGGTGGESDSSEKLD